MKITTSVKTMFQTVCRIDKNSLLIGIAYNLIKQLMNVFYGVYFIRLILVGLETRKSIGHILTVLVVMFLIQLLFGRFEQYYKNVYAPERGQRDCADFLYRAVFGRCRLHGIAVDRR